MEKLEKTAKAEIVEAQRFLMTQTREFIIKVWLLEFLEHKRAVSFIRNKGLYAEYIKVGQFK